MRHPRPTRARARMRRSSLRQPGSNSTRAWHPGPPCSRVRVRAVCPICRRCLHRSARMQQPTARERRPPLCMCMLSHRGPLSRPLRGHRPRKSRGRTLGGGAKRMPRGERAEREHRFAAFRKPPPPPPPCLRRRICRGKGASKTTFSFKDILLHGGTSSWSAAFISRRRSSLLLTCPPSGLGRWRGAGGLRFARRSTSRRSAAPRADATLTPGSQRTWVSKAVHVDEAKGTLAGGGSTKRV